MGKNPRLSFRYWLKGTDTLRMQIYSLTKGYHRYLTLTGLPQEKWQSGTVDMTAGAPARRQRRPAVGGRAHRRRPVLRRSAGRAADRRHGALRCGAAGGETALSEAIPLHRLVRHAASRARNGQARSRSCRSRAISGTRRSRSRTRSSAGALDSAAPARRTAARRDDATCSLRYRLERRRFDEAGADQPHAEGWPRRRADRAEEGRVGAR